MVGGKHFCFALLLHPNLGKPFRQELTKSKYLQRQNRSICRQDLIQPVVTQQVGIRGGKRVGRCSVGLLEATSTGTWSECPTLTRAQAPLHGSRSNYTPTANFDTADIPLTTPIRTPNTRRSHLSQWTVRLSPPSHSPTSTTIRHPRSPTHAPFWPLSRKLYVSHMRLSYGRPARWRSCSCLLAKWGVKL